MILIYQLNNKITTLSSLIFRKIPNNDLNPWIMIYSDLQEVIKPDSKGTYKKLLTRVMDTIYKISSKGFLEKRLIITYLREYPDAESIVERDYVESDIKFFENMTQDSGLRY